jgi:hypothetical protein
MQLPGKYLSPFFNAKKLYLSVLVSQKLRFFCGIPDIKYAFSGFMIIIRKSKNTYNQICWPTQMHSRLQPNSHMMKFEYAIDTDKMNS